MPTVKPLRRSKPKLESSLKPNGAAFPQEPHLANQDWLEVLKIHRAIAVIRTDDIALGRDMAKAVAAGGCRLIEVTWNSDRPGTLIETLRTELPHCLIGCGTLLSLADLKLAILAGIQFAFMPHTDAEMIQYGRDRQIPMHPGTLTPTEIVTAWNAGASAVKVFPVGAVGGVDYIRRLQAPLDRIPLIPTGGVTLENARAFIEAGAIALGLAEDLFPPASVQQRDWQAITNRMQNLVHSLQTQQTTSPSMAL
ncbi:MAG: bifunctional 4-hydroxy-2-oxoglutarate aldolase/2-dehydro-3-deoxy-phosphogluconate aldolase [Thermosynechococcaceae cyanobacterium MS004]|nr:bifunctional 4-hydroxy-2-oxoglutarate aldolase/2-dehydro-3-deoxy-phosphogluconate aldolase [Thermosynechococcaceae cyanobacterium MS004]